MLFLKVVEVHELLEVERLKLEILFGSNLQARSKFRVTKSPLKRRQLRFNYFVNKQNKSLELLSFHFRCLAGSANKDCVSSKGRTSWAMKGKQKMK